MPSTLKSRIDSLKFELRYFVLTKKVISFLLTRARYVASIWASVFLLVWLSFQIPGLSCSNTKALLVTKMVSLADPLLVGTLFAGTLVIVILQVLISRNVRPVGPFGEKLGQGWITKALDEISSAATHFVAISMLCLFLTGFDSKQIPVLWLALALFLLAVLCFDAAGNDERYSLPKKEEYEATIASPETGQTLGQTVPLVSGSIRFPAPEGYRVWLVRLWPSQRGTYYPVKEVEYPDLEPEAVESDDRSDGSISWVATNVFIGGQAGDKRKLEVWLIGPEGRALIEAWTRGNEQFERVRKVTQHKILFPGVVKRTRDMIQCSTITLDCDGTP
jgi:hypothetical protein